MSLYPSVLLFILMLMGLAHDAVADVGTREILLHERHTMVAELNALSGDSSLRARQSSDSLRAAIIAVDSRIIRSYDETLARLYAQKRRRATNDRAITLFALLCCVVALASVLALWLAHARIQREEGRGLPALYRQLFQDLMLTVRPQGVASPVLRRVSPVVILGIIGMMASIIVYLISSLR